MASIGEVKLIASIDTAAYKKGASEIDKANKDIEGSTEKASTNTSKYWNTASQVATGAIIAAGVLIAKTFVQSASEIQSLRASFESLTGNVDDTNSVMSELYQLGKETAFSNKDIQAAGRNYLAAGVSVEGLNEVLKNTADIAGATGADLGQLTLPLTQTIARGKLQTQDFYQILNSGAGALRKPLTELAGSKGFGSLAEALEQGAISSDDLLKVLGDVTKEGGFAFQGAIKQSETFNGRMSNLQEAITNVGLSIIGVDAITGEVDPAGPFAQLSNAVSSATKFLTENEDTIKTVGTVIAIFLVPAIIALGVQGLLAGARLAAGILLALGPIGLIIATVAAATFLIIANWDSISSFVVGVWENIKGAAIATFDWIKSNWPLLLAIITGPIGLAVYAIAKNFDTIKDMASNVVNTILSFFSGIPGKLSGLFNGIGSSLGQSIKNALNSLLDLPLSVPSIEIAGKTFGGQTLIPRLAEGGIVSSPTLAMIGEGPESEAVIPLSKLDNILSEKGASNSNITVNLSMSGIMSSSKSDERAIANRMGKLINETLTAKGAKVIEGL